MGACTSKDGVQPKALKQKVGDWDAQDSKGVVTKPHEEIDPTPRSVTLPHQSSGTFATNFRRYDSMESRVTAQLEKKKHALAVSRHGGRARRGSILGESYSQVKQEALDEIAENESAEKKGGGAPPRDSSMYRESKSVGTPKSPEERKWIMDVLDSNFIFASLNEEELDIVITAMQKVEYGENEVVLKAGEEGTSFFVLMDGRLEAVDRETPTPTALVPGTQFGELALMYNTPSEVEVTTRAKSVLWKVDRDVFRRIVVTSNVRTVAENRKFLSRMKMFKGLSSRDLYRLAEAMQLQTFPDASVIIKQGEVGNVFYVLVRGAVMVSKIDTEDGEDVELMRLGIGQCFGEQALLNSTPRAATVTAVGPVSCMALSKDDFVGLLGPLEGRMRRYHSEREDVEAGVMLKRSESRRLNLIPSTHSLTSVGSSPSMSTPSYKPRSGSKALAPSPLASPSSKKRTHGGGGGGSADETPRSGFGSAAGTGSPSITTPGAVVLKPHPPQGTSEGASPRVSRALSTPTPADPRRSVRDRDREARESIKLEDLEMCAPLGEGAFGLVRLVRHKPTGKTYALKQMQKSRIVSAGQQRNVLNEKKIMMKYSGHPYILHLVKTFRTKDCLYMLLEFLQGGDMFGLLARSGGTFRPSVAVHYASIVLVVLEYLHSYKIVYRDLKPENLVLSGTGRLKVCDFGFAKRVTERTYTLCGTPEYLAPELIQGSGHHRGVDFWALGILVYEMLVGYSPFADHAGNQQIVIYKNILRGKLVFPAALKSTTAIDLIRRLLTPSASKRLGCLRGGAEDVKKHAWFSEMDFEALLSERIKPPIVPKVRNATDTSNFDSFTPDSNKIKPYVDDGSGWDAGF